MNCFKIIPVLICFCFILVSGCKKSQSGTKDKTTNSDLEKLVEVYKVKNQLLIEKNIKLEDENKLLLIELEKTNKNMNVDTMSTNVTKQWFKDVEKDTVEINSSGLIVFKEITFNPGSTLLSKKGIKAIKQLVHNCYVRNSLLDFRGKYRLYYPAD